MGLDSLSSSLLLKLGESLVKNTDINDDTPVRPLNDLESPYKYLQIIASKYAQIFDETCQLQFLEEEVIFKSLMPYCKDYSQCFKSFAFFVSK